jgi:hypothetical protein
LRLFDPLGLGLAAGILTVLSLKPSTLANLAFHLRVQPLFAGVSARE